MDIIQVNKFSLRSLSFFLIVLILTACQKNSTSPSNSFAEKTILIYMEADNDLYYFAEQNLKEIKATQIPQKTNLMVFISGPKDSPYINPQLLQIKNGQTEVIKTYERSSYRLDREGMTKIFKDTFEKLPAQKTGLILWSHGTGWLPAGSYENLNDWNTNFSSPHQSLVKAFGRKDSQELNIVDLAKAIPFKLDFILLDACLMGGIEVYYELKDKTEIIIASPTDVLSTGFPYHTVLPFLLSKNENFNEAAQQYMDAYKERSGFQNSATVSVIKTSELDEFSKLVKDTFSKNKISFAQLEGSQIDRLPIQRLDGLSSTVFFDLVSFYQKILGEEDVTLIQKHLSKVIVFKDFTKYFLTIPIQEFSGLSTYIPGSLPEKIQKEYKKLAWYKAIYE